VEFLSSEKREGYTNDVKKIIAVLDAYENKGAAQERMYTQFKAIWDKLEELKGSEE
jgi:hypothetical protein